MKVILLGVGAKNLKAFLDRKGELSAWTDQPLSEGKIPLNPEDFLVSYGYQHIIKEPLLSTFKKRPINLHISLLPWNRGADPNAWSFLENTPKGVTIHEIDAGLDTGPVLLQKEVSILESDTLRSSYERLKNEIEKLFQENWVQLKQGTLNPLPQKGEGTLHRKRDLQKYENLFSKGWDTPVHHLIAKAIS